MANVAEVILQLKDRASENLKKVNKEVDQLDKSLDNVDKNKSLDHLDEKAQQLYEHLDKVGSGFRAAGGVLRQFVTVPILGAFGTLTALALNNTKAGKDLKDQWDNTVRTFKDVAASFANDLLPILQTGLQYVQKFAEWVSNLSETQRKWIIRIGLVVAAIGPLIFGLGQAIDVVVQMNRAFVAMRAIMIESVLPALAPFLPIIAAIAAAVAAFVIAYKTNFLGIGDATHKAIAFIKDKFDWLKAILVTAVENFGILKDGIFGIFMGIREMLSGFPDIMKGVFEKAVSVASAVFVGLGQSVASIFSTVVNTIIDGINFVVEKLNWLSGKVPGGKHLQIPTLNHLTLGVGNLADVWNEAKDKITAANDNIDSGTRKMADGANMSYNSAKDAIGNFKTAVVDTKAKIDNFKPSADDASGAIKGIGDSADAASKKVKNLKDTISGIPGVFASNTPISGDRSGTSGVQEGIRHTADQAALREAQRTRDHVAAMTGAASYNNDLARRQAASSYADLNAALNQATKNVTTFGDELLRNTPGGSVPGVWTGNTPVSGNRTSPASLIPAMNAAQGAAREREYQRTKQHITAMSGAASPEAQAARREAASTYADMANMWREADKTAKRLRQFAIAQGNAQLLPLQSGGYGSYSENPNQTSASTIQNSYAQADSLKSQIDGLTSSDGVTKLRKQLEQLGKDYPWLSGYVKTLTKDLNDQAKAIKDNEDLQAYIKSLDDIKGKIDAASSAAIDLFSALGAPDSAIKGLQELAGAADDVMNGLKDLATGNWVGAIAAGIHAVVGLIRGLIDLFTPQWVKVAREIKKNLEASVSGALVSAFEAFAKGDIKLDDLKTQIHNAIYESVLNALIQSFIIGQVLKPVIDRFTRKLSEDMAKGNNSALQADTNEFIKQINASVSSYIPMLEKIGGNIIQTTKDAASTATTMQTQTASFGDFVSQTVSIPLYDASVSFKSSVADFGGYVHNLIDQGITVHSDVTISSADHIPA